MKLFYSLLMVLLCLSLELAAQHAKVIQLPEPDLKLEMPLMQALQERTSSRTFADKPISMQEISTLLWAANGINRPESGKRTAPSARNWQDIAIYVILAEGAYLYDAKGNTLNEVLQEDVRSLAGMQDYAKTAPLNLIYVSDQAKMGAAAAEDKWLLSGADAAFIAENVYLYCAARELAVVVRAMIDKEALAKKLGLGTEQKIIIAQTIGYKVK